MSTSTKALSVAFAATLAGGAALGSAQLATAAAPAVNTPSMVSTVKQAEEVTITIDDFAYEVSGPVTPGATVTVINNDEVAHTATDPNGAFDTGIIEAGATATFTAPQEAGQYTLNCTIHPNMSGTLMVEAAAGMGDGSGDDSSMGGDSASDSSNGSSGVGAGGGGDEGMEQQVSPMPEGGADTGVTESGNAADPGVLALGGGLVLIAAAGGTYVVRRRSAHRS